MKRKLALLLAGSMVLSTVPATTIFAANGDITLGTAMSTPTNTTTTKAAVVVIGDSNQDLPANGAFTFELVNAKFVGDYSAGTAYTSTVDSTAIGSVKTQVLKTDTTMQVTVDAGKQPKMAFDFKVKDATQPAYIKCTWSTADDKFEGKQLQLTKVVGTQAITGKVSTAATQQTLVQATGANVTFSSDLAGAWDDNGTETSLTITLPSGFSFDKLVDPTITVVGEDASNEQDANVDFEYTNSQTLTVTVPKFTDNLDNVFGSSVKIAGLTINNDRSTYGSDVMATLKVEGKTAGTAAIAKFNTFGLTTSISSTATIPTIQAGLSENNSKFELTKTDDKKANVTVAAETGSMTGSNNETVMFTIKESIVNSYRGGDLIVTLPEGVKITGAKVVDYNTNVDGIGTDETAIAADATDYNSKADSATAWTTTPMVTPNVIAKDNVLTLKNVKSNDVTKKFELRITLEVEAAADFSGDVVAVLSSGKNAIDVVKDITIGTIAKFESVYAVETKVSEVLVGYTSQPVADIVISEKKEGTFTEGEEFTISLADEFGDSYVGQYGIASATAKVTAGEADVETSIDKENAVIKVTVKNITSDKPIAITVSDVKVFSNRNVPTYNGSGDVITVEVESDKNLEIATSDEYIKFVNELGKVEDVIAGTSAYNQDVKLSMNSSTATLADGTKVDLYGAPYISADNNTMMPLKGMGFALGLKPEDIVYDSATQTATFFLANNGIAQVTVGVEYATVNGAKVPLIDASGKKVAPVVKDGRFYLPLRAASKTIFGVETSYNADKTVTINPSK